MKKKSVVNLSIDWLSIEFVTPLMILTITLFWNLAMR